MTIPKLSSMTESEIRVKCAELVGYTAHEIVTWPHRYTHSWKSPSGNIVYGLPDYLHDERFAITLCNWMAEKGWTATLESGNGGWRVWFRDMNETHFGESDSLATAITHAFCLANNLAEL